MYRFNNQQYLKKHIISHISYKRWTNLPTTINQKEPAIRCITQHKDLNPCGTISGGWLMSQMDIAGGIAAWDNANGPIHTVVCKNLQFHKPVKYGELVSFYVDIIEAKKTSIQVFVEGKSRKPPSLKELLIASGTFIYVAVNENSSPRKVISNTDLIMQAAKIGQKIVSLTKPIVDKAINSV